MAPLQGYYSEVLPTLAWLKRTDYGLSGMWWLVLLCLTVLVLGALLSSFLEEALYKCSIWMNEWMIGWTPEEQSQCLWKPIPDIRASHREEMVLLCESTRNRDKKHPHSTEPRQPRWDSKDCTILNLTLTKPHNTYEDILSAIRSVNSSTTAHTLTSEICI